MQKSGKNKDDLKRINRGAVLKLIATGRSTTRAGLVSGTGLSKMAISKIVSEMMDRRLIVETDSFKLNESGRHPRGLDIAPDGPRVAGLMIHRNRCEAVLCDLRLRIFRRKTVWMPAHMDRSGLKKMLCEALDAVLSDAGDVSAIGVASIGPISVQRGMILSPFYFHGIENVPVVEWIRKRYRLPVYFDHDNQSSVLLEHLYGNAVGFKDVLYIGIGTGVGCGVLLNGRLYANDRGLPPEFGHVSVDLNGPLCACGNRGCVEAYVRTPAVLQTLQRRSGRPLSCTDVREMASDPDFEAVITTCVEPLAAAIISVVNMLNSELIILGNDAVYWPDQQLNALQRSVNARRFVEWDQPVLIRRAHFLKDAPMLGAACNAISAFFEGELTTGE